MNASPTPAGFPATPPFQATPVGNTVRIGVKGPAAAEWLAAQGVSVPAGANRITRFDAPARGRCLRLGHTEFLIEQDGGSEWLYGLEAALRGAPAGCHLATRCDRSFLLAGPGLLPALRQIADFDFDGSGFATDGVVMTLMAGISVTFVREPLSGPGALRLWCDPGFGDYLAGCLVALGGTTPILSSPSAARGPSP